MIFEQKTSNFKDVGKKKALKIAKNGHIRKSGRRKNISFCQVKESSKPTDLKISKKQKYNLTRPVYHGPRVVESISAI